MKTGAGKIEEDKGLDGLKFSDRELWDQFRVGNSEALFSLYKRLQLPLINYALKISGDKQLAQDSFSDLMVSLWDRRGKLTEVSNVKSYLMTALRRQLLSDIKLHARFDQIEDNNGNAEVSNEELIINAQELESLKQHLIKAFAKLSPRQRQFVTDRFYGGLSYEEIAAENGVDIKAVYNKVYEGIKILRKNLPDVYKDSPSLLIFFLLFNGQKPTLIPE